MREGLGKEIARRRYKGASKKNKLKQKNTRKTNKKADGIPG